MPCGKQGKMARSRRAKLILQMESIVVRIDDCRADTSVKEEVVEELEQIQTLSKA